jgi:hypothetical protein
LQTLVALCALVSCARLPGCGGALAEVAEAHGSVERDFDAQRGRWQRAAVGEQLESGDGLRTGPRSSAVLRVGRGGVMRVESETTLRLLLPGAGRDEGSAPDIEIESGEAVIEAGQQALSLHTQTGSAVLQAGSRVRLSRQEKGVRYEVVMGSAAFAQGGGERAELRAGQSITIGIGMAVLEEVGAAKVVAAAAKGPTYAAVAPTQDESEAAGAGTVQAVVSGDVRRRARGAPGWLELAPGTTRLGAGDELEVRENGEAELARGDERARLRRGRFEIGGQGAPIVRAMDGELLVTADRAAVAISVPGGTIVATPVPGGSRAGIIVDGGAGSTEVEVLTGSVKTVGPDGETQLAAGEQATLAVQVAGAASARRAPGSSRSAEHAELLVTVGETFRVYDPAPPTAIGFTLGKRCPSGAELRIDGLEPVRGERQINVLLGPGLRTYRVFCLGPEASGRPEVTASVRVLRSDGTRRPPTTPTKNSVDVDGRQYTLMYQNLRPILNVSWPEAPRAQAYELHLRRPDGRTALVRSKQPRAVVEPGLLGDGVHVLRFESAGTARARSKDTKVNLVFDNAAPTASLGSPAPAGFAPGESTTVSGIAVARSSASVDGKAVPVDRGGRFEARVPLRPGQRALAVRFKHAVHGIRYYVRRAAGGEP